MVAEDFVAGLRRLVDPATASQYAQIIDVVANAGDIINGKQKPEALGVSAPDDAPVVVQLTAPAPYFPGSSRTRARARFIARRSPLIANEIAKPGVMVSNGAFLLKEWVPGLHVLAVRNPNYWNNAATHLDGVKYLHIADENAELTRYRAGGLHVTAVVPRGQFEWIKAEPRRRAARQPAAQHLLLRLQPAPPALQDNAGSASRAVSRDRSRAAREVRAESRRSAGVRLDPARRLQLHVAVVRLRGQAARGSHCRSPQALRRSGLLSRRSRFASSSATTLAKCTTASPWPSARCGSRRSVSKRNRWRVEFKSLLQDIDRGDVEMFRSSWVGDYNDAYTFAQYLKGDFGINLPRYQSAEYDRLLVAAAAEADAAKRRELLQQAESVMLKDHPLLPLYFYVNKHLIKPRGAGLVRQRDERDVQPRSLARR